jgi:hypothetical protein
LENKKLLHGSVSLVREHFWDLIGIIQFSMRCYVLLLADMRKKKKKRKKRKKEEKMNIKDAQFYYCIWEMYVIDLFNSQQK